jgi:hypothetical protein
VSQCAVNSCANDCTVGGVDASTPTEGGTTSD